MPKNNKLQIIISAGPGDHYRATLGFASAAAAVASGLEVVVFLAMEGVWWSGHSTEAQAAFGGFPPIAELIDSIRAGGGRIESCASCMDGVCGVPQYDNTRFDGIVPSGLTTVVLRASESPTLTF